MLLLFIAPVLGFGQSVFESKYELYKAAELYSKHRPIAIIFLGEINTWDVSKITDMSSIFGLTESFNEDISSWDVSNVTDMSYMFFSAASFNQDISSWDNVFIKFNGKVLLYNEDESIKTESYFSDGKFIRCVKGCE